MPKIRFTEGVIRSLVRKAEAAGKTLEFTDQDTPFEFGLRATIPNSRYRKGRLSWFCRVTFRGAKKRFGLGDYPGVGLAEARDAAWAHRLDVKRGVDPRAAENGKTFGELLEEYRATRVHLSDGTKYLDKLWLEKRLSDWHCIPLASITRRMIADRQLQERSRGDQCGDAFKGALGTMLSYAMDRGYIDSNPAFRLKDLYKNRPRKRYLSDEEIPIVWNFLEQEASSISYAIRMLLLVGQRPREVYQMPYHEISGEWWNLPAARTKPRRDHRIYLSEPARDLVSKMEGRSVARKRDGAIYRPVFPGRRPNRALESITSCMERFRKAHPEIPHWIPHDCRRTFRTWLARQECPKEISKALLNHSDKDISDDYNCWMYEPQRIQWWTRYGEHIMSLVKG